MWPTQLHRINESNSPTSLVLKIVERGVISSYLG